MSHSESNEVSADRRKEFDAFQTRIAHAAEVFRELTNLLEEYAPVWYTEEHHNRAVAALRDLEESRQLAKTEAARSQKAG